MIRMTCRDDAPFFTEKRHVFFHNSVAQTEKNIHAVIYGSKMKIMDHVFHSTVPHLYPGFQFLELIAVFPHRFFLLLSFFSSKSGPESGAHVGIFCELLS